MQLITHGSIYNINQSFYSNSCRQTDSAVIWNRKDRRGDHQHTDRNRGRFKIKELSGSSKKIEEMEVAEDGICVSIRIRPLSESEIAQNQGVAFQCIPKYNQIGQLKDGQLMRGQTFDFDRVFDEHSTTNQIYTASARKLVANVVNGINGTIFACKIFICFPTTDSSCSG
jgi:hypothetical protein